MATKATQQVVVELSPETIRQIALKVVFNLAGFSIEPRAEDGYYIKADELWHQSGRHPRDTHDRVRKLTIKDIKYISVMEEIRSLSTKQLENIE